MKEAPLGGQPVRNNFGEGRGGERERVTFCTLTSTLRELSSSYHTTMLWRICLRRFLTLLCIYDNYFIFFWFSAVVVRRKVVAIAMKHPQIQSFVTGKPISIYTLLWLLLLLPNILAGSILLYRGVGYTYCINDEIFMGSNKDQPVARKDDDD